MGSKMCRPKNKNYSKYKIGTSVFLKKSVENLPKNYQLEVKDNEKKTREGKKYSIILVDTLGNGAEYIVQTKYLYT